MKLEATVISFLKRAFNLIGITWVSKKRNEGFVPWLDIIDQKGLVMENKESRCLCNNITISLAESINLGFLSDYNKAQKTPAILDKKIHSGNLKIVDRI